MIKTRPQIDYILGGLMGLCVGDALGVPAEFKNREELDENPITGMMGGGPHGQPAGTWSDDSSLTFCLAESLCKKYDLDDIAKKFCQWLQDGYWTPYGKVFDVGTTTKNAILKLCDGEIPTLAGGYREQDNGNGSLMRILPLVFYTEHMDIAEKFNKILQVSSLTHKHKISIIACFIYILMASRLIFAAQYGKDKKDAFDSMRHFLPEILQHDWEWLPNFERIIGYDPTQYPLIEEYPLQSEEFQKTNTFIQLKREDIKSTGYVIDTLEAALWCFLKNDNYKDTVLTAINLGGDTDTVAAIAGGLAGIYYGFEDIPKEWVNTIARKDDIVELAKRLKEETENRDPYIIIEKFKNVNFKKPNKKEIRESYQKGAECGRDEIARAKGFSAATYGYPNSQDAVVIAADIARAVHNYYYIHNDFSVFPLSYLCTTVFFWSRANHHQGYYPEPDAVDAAIAKEIMKKIHQIIN